jgi:hypothetical protein
VLGTVSETVCGCGGVDAAKTRRAISAQADNYAHAIRKLFKKD